MLKKIGKRVLSLMLALVLVATTFFIFDPSVLFTETNAVVETSSSGPAVYFYVPEVIYLNPNNTNFQYYADMASVSLNTSTFTCSRALSQARTDTVGNIYFYYRYATQVNFTQSGASWVTMSQGLNANIACGSNYVTTSNITAGAVGSYASTYITWTATYVDSLDGLTKTATACSYVYAPYRGSVAGTAAGISVKSSANAIGGISSVIYGIHSIELNADNSRTVVINGSGFQTRRGGAGSIGTGGYQTAALRDPICGPTDNAYDWRAKDEPPFRYGTGVGMGWSHTTKKDAGDSTGVSGIGRIYVDTSRYSDFSQIPNFGVRFDFHTCRNRDDHEKVDVSNWSSWGTVYYLNGNFSSNSWVREDGYGEIQSNGGRADAKSVQGTPKGAINCNVIAMRQYLRFKRSSGNNPDTNAIAMTYVYTQNRESLRTAVENAVKNSYRLQQRNFPNHTTEWNTFYNALLDAERHLGQIDSTNYDAGKATTLTNAMNVLLNLQYTATQNNAGLADSNGTLRTISAATSNGTATIQRAFKPGDKVTMTAETYNGYDYKGYIQNGATTNSITMSNLVGGGVTINPAVDQNYSYTFYYLLKTYTITLNANGGTVTPNSVSYNIEMDSVTPTTPKRDGYRFTGWKVTTADGNWTANSSYPAGKLPVKGKYGNITLTAQWVATFNVEYDGNGNTGGTKPANETHDFGETVWPAENTFTKAYIVNYNVNASDVSNPPASSETATFTFSHWKSNKNAVTEYHPKSKFPEGYVDNYGVTIAGQTATLKAQWTGGTIKLPSAGTRSGYAFIGWYDDADFGNFIGNEGDTYTATKNITLYAHWIENSELENHAITIDLRGNSKAPASIGSIIYQTVEGTGNNKKLVKKVLNEQSNVTSSFTIQVAYGTGITLPIPKRGENYDFLGWTETVHANGAELTDNGTLSASKYIVGSGDGTLAAAWSGYGSNINAYAMGNNYKSTKYSYRGGTVGITNETVADGEETPTPAVGISAALEPGTTFTFVATPAAGYKFVGWYSDRDLKNQISTNATYSGITVPSSGLTYYARFDVQSYKVTIDPVACDNPIKVYDYYNPAGKQADSSTINTSTAFTAVYGSTIKFGLPSRTGYEFDGWEVTSGSVQKFRPSTSGVSSAVVAASDAKITAKWTPAPYEITYKPNGGKVGDSTNDFKQGYTIETDITLLTPTRDGYTFTGWKVTTKAGNWEQDKIITDLEVGKGKYGNVTLTAQWKVNTYTITYAPNGGSVSPTTINYTIEDTVNLLSPTKDGNLFTGWQVTKVDANGNWTKDAVYLAKDTVSNMFGNVTLTAQWLETKAADDEFTNPKKQENNIEIIKGTDASGNAITENKNRYDSTSFSSYTAALTNYENAKNSLPTDSSAADFAAKRRTAIENIESAMKELSKATNSLKENTIVTEYLNKFFIDGSTTRHSFAEINLNHYVTNTLNGIKGLIDSGNVYKSGTYTITQKDSTGKTYQQIVNNIVKQMATAFKNTENIPTTPSYTLYDSAESIKEQLEKSGLGVNYVMKSGGSTTYYCYTNKANPTVYLTVDVAATNGRACYPTRSTLTQENVENILGKTSAVTTGGTLETRDVTSTYSEYLNAGLGTTYSEDINGTAYTGTDYYNKQSLIKLAPEFTEGKDGAVKYTIVSEDDSLTPNKATKTKSSAALDNTLKAISDDNGSTLTIVIDYHTGAADADGKMVPIYAWGAQTSEDVWLKQYHIFRSAQGARNWELPQANAKTDGKTQYIVNDDTYGQSDRGSFTFTFELASTNDIANGKLNTTNVDEIIGILQNSGSYNAAVEKTFIGTNKDGDGLGYQKWGTNWSFNYYPKSGAYTYVHLVDRWGNTCDDVFCVGNQDSFPIQSAKVNTLTEKGGSGISTLSLDAEIELIADENSVIDGEVYKTTGNTVRFKTPAANKSYTLTMTDKATNQSTATLTSDENGIVSLNVEDEAYSGGVYTFTLNGKEINLYAELEKRHVISVENGTAYTGSSATAKIITDGSVSKVRLIDKNGNTITNNSCVRNADGTKTWQFTRKMSEGEYSYSISTKVGEKWGSETATVSFKFTKKAPATGKLMSAEYEDGLYKLTLEGKGTKVQFTDRIGLTRTYSRSNSNVKKVVENGDGTEVWYVKTKLIKGAKYTVAAKFNAGWNRTDTVTITAE